MSLSNDHKQGERTGYLDGIRGLAILLVAAGHIFYQYYIFQIGWIGLNLFFILSGYLITQRLYVHYSENKASYFKNFYGRRVLRIFPLYYGCLIIFFILLPLFYSGYYRFYGSLYNAQGWYWTYTSNWMMIIHGLPDQPGFFHFWSLAVEEQFYIIWPFLFLLLVRMKNASIAVVIFLILVSIFLRNYIDGNTYSYLSTSTAAEPLLLGALVAMLEKKEKIKKSYKYFLLLAICSVVTLVIVFIHDTDLHITNDWLLHTGYTAIDLVWIYILILCILNKPLSGVVKRMFNARWLKWLGKYSYGIYVFHWLMLNFVVYKTVKELINSGVNTNVAYFSARIAGIVLILVISFLSYNLYEKRFLALKKYFK